MRILLGGVPFGCDNVGDEAILECSAAIFRRAIPKVGITVATRDQRGTADRLDVQTCGLLGFFDDVSPAETERVVDAHDCFVWCGATGLSDYPETTLPILELAQRLGKKTVVWCVGMNDELNPAFYRLSPGNRRRLLRAATTANLGTADLVSWEERRRAHATRRRIARVLDEASLLVVRDPQSRDELVACGVTREIVVGADSALLLQAAHLDETPLPPGLREVLVSDSPKVGLCISAQRPIEREEGLAQCLDAVVRDAGARLVCIPMNPLTDSALMARLLGRLEARDRTVVVTGAYTPSEILAIAARMNVIVSSRLHLLILGAVGHVPLVGIARGSKVDNFLSCFGLTSVGSVDDCNFAELKAAIGTSLGGKAHFQRVSRRVNGELLQRLESAVAELARTLG